MRRQLQDQRHWHPVFAWLPVTTECGQRVWLETVERRYKFSSWWEDYYEFRFPAQGMEAATAGETEGLDPKDDSPVRASECAQTPSERNHS